MRATAVSHRAGTLAPADPLPATPGWLLESLSAVGIVGLAFGVRLLEATDIGGSVPEALSGAASQMPATAVALFLVTLASMANLGLGVIVGRAVLGRPFEGMGSMVLAGVSFAILVDCFLLMIVGGLGLFVWPVILAIHAVVFAAGIVRGGRLLASRAREAGWHRSTPWLALVLPVAVWGAPIVLALASPVVPFMDVLFNHVAPVEHVREFGSFETLTTSPAANLGPSRTLFGYVALESVIATLTDLPAHLSVSAFGPLLAALVALASWRGAVALFGRGAGYWSLITVPLTFVFLRIPDARATVLVFVPVAASLVFLIDPPIASRLRQQLLLAAGLGAALYVHPFIGGMAVLTVIGLSVGWPDRFASLGLPAAVGAGLVALPQAMATLGIAAPSVVGALALPLAFGGLWLVDRWNAIAVRLARATVIAAAVAALLVVVDLFRFSAEALRDLASPFPLVAVGALAAFFVAGDRAAGLRVVGVGIIVAMLTVAGSRLLAPGTALVDSLQVESTPKALWYWSPYLLALASAGALSRLASLKRWPLPGQGIVAAFVVLAVVPFRFWPADVGINNYTEHRMAESVAIVLHHSQHGYWVGYPDARNLVDSTQVEVLDRLRAEREAGILTVGSHLLHVAPSFQPWIATPVAIFTGIHETIAALETDPSVHGQGGREYLTSEVPRLLTAGYEYLLIEGDDLLAEWRAPAEAAGYESIFSNQRGVLFRLAATGRPSVPEM